MSGAGIKLRGTDGRWKEGTRRNIYQEFSAKTEALHWECVLSHSGKERDLLSTLLIMHSCKNISEAQPESMRSTI